MTIIDWNKNVNTEFFLDGEYGYEEGNVNSLEFESGKKRTFLKNSYIPKKYPSINLALDNTVPVTFSRENTEFKQFDYWYRVMLRYGSLPFYAPRIGYKRDIAVYEFIPESLNYDETDGIIMATFGLVEISYREIDVIESSMFIAFENGDYWIAETGDTFVTK